MLRSTATVMFGHVDGYRHWARHLLRVRALQEKTGGFTELVPLPFVHIEAPIYLKGHSRKVPTFRSEFDREMDAQLVSLGQIKNDTSEFRSKYEPGHPAADSAGNVKYPNINPLVEMTDMREAQRSYEANFNVIGATRRMIQRTIDILKA